MAEDLIALFDFELVNERVTILSERHYRLVYEEDLGDEEVATYRDRPDG
jgi:hypothetical protein